MKVVNIHTRDLAAPPAEVGRLLESLAGSEDQLWPTEQWPAMRFDRPLGVGARGGHGPIRYTVAEHEPGRRIRFTFTAPAGFDGFHELRVEEGVGAGTRLVHDLRMDARGSAVLSWPLVFRPLHDALVEDALSKAQRSLGEPARPTPWSLRVRTLRAGLRRLLRRRSARSG